MALGILLTLVCVYMFTCVWIASSSINLAVWGPTRRSDALSSAAYAVDGDVQTDHHSCHCCFVSNVGYSWLRVDLGQEYRIASVKIYGRTDKLNVSYSDLNNVNVYLHTEVHNKGTPLYQIPATPQIRYFNYTVTPSMIARYVTLDHENSLEVCELKVHKDVLHGCQAGRYGPGCQLMCGHCENGTPCDPDSGNCEACGPGYTGNMCKQECHHGQFGRFCAGICRCTGNATCHPVTGACPGSRCAFGLAGNNCTINLNRALGKDVTLDDTFSGWPAERVVDGLYSSYTSDYCTAVYDWLRVDLGTMYAVSTVTVYGGIIGGKINIYVHMNKTTRDSATVPIETDTVFYTYTFVSPIMARYVTLENTGLTFVIICELQVYGDCPSGTFGNNCEGNCSRNCNSSCDQISGLCTYGCIAGWEGDYCDRECAQFSFGQNCSHTCHCINDSQCDHVDGLCDMGLCEPGWRGPSCDHAIPDLFPAYDENHTAYFASVIAVFTVIGVVMTLCVLKRRTRGMSRLLTRNTENPGNPAASNVHEMIEMVAIDRDLPDSTEPDNDQGVNIEEMISSDPDLEREHMEIISSSDIVPEREFIANTASSDPDLEH